MKYFITGGGGYIGRWLVKKLAEKGHELNLLARDPERLKLPDYSGILL